MTTSAILGVNQLFLERSINMPPETDLVFPSESTPPIHPIMLSAMIDEVIGAHHLNAREPRKRFRKWDGATPYAIHPIWCAMTLLTETSLPIRLREDGCVALLYHDVPEDTTAELREDRIPRHARYLVDEMTFANFEQEMELVWSRSQNCILLKLYDKVSNLLDMNRQNNKRGVYLAYTEKLCDRVEELWGGLNIVRIARAIIQAGREQV